MRISDWSSDVCSSDLCKGTDYAAFFSTQSTQKQKEFNTDAANANARLSAQLQYIFAVSRVAHYLKSMMRDKIGSFASKSSVELFLNNWIAQYVPRADHANRKSVVEGKRGAVRVALGGRGVHKKKKKKRNE